MTCREKKETKLIYFQQVFPRRRRRDVLAVYCGADYGGCGGQMVGVGGYVNGWR